MKKRFKKILVGTSLTLVSLTGLLIALILYPNNLFARRITHKTFNIYTNQAISQRYASVLDEALMLVKNSELYDSSYQYDIFLADGTFYKQVVNRLTGPALARSLDNNIILNIKADFAQNLLTGPRNKRDLAATIAHEMVHCLQMHKYGLMKFNPVKHPPLWKLEGYPEYIARQDEINTPGYTLTGMVRALKENIDKKVSWIELKPGHFDPLIYLKGRVLVEYLMNIKGMSYDQILKDDVKEDLVYNELLEWYAVQTVQF